ncbi:hypothetical protein HW132_33210 [Brasilonema sp. CT11]|nr:hypothetical protein [Brasilonema sp. CT11]
MSTPSLLKNSLTGYEAFTTWLGLAYKPGEKIWFKSGNDQFFTGIIEGFHFPIWETGGSEKKRRNVNYHANAFNILSERSTERDGGVFYIPGKPTDYPLKEYCYASDDLAGEMDDGTADEQWKQIESLAHHSGLSFAYIITSGGKSFHPHFKLTVAVPIDQRTRYQQLIAIALIGDPAVCNPHQPMRAPGFFRRDKGKQQELVFHSEARYTPEEFERGMQRCFAALGLTWHDQLSDERWSALKRVLASKVLSRTEKLTNICQLLALPERDLPRNVENRENEERRAQRLLNKTTSLSTSGGNLIDAVTQASIKLGADAFDWAGHNWQWSGSNHARGCCPWHESTTGLAAWINPKKSGDGWGFACPTCTDNRQIDGFSYWWQLRNGLGATYPTGKEWVEAAKQYCEWAGVAVPEYTPQYEYINDLGVENAAHHNQSSEEYEEGLALYTNSQKLESFLTKTFTKIKGVIAKASKHIGISSEPEVTPGSTPVDGVTYFKKGDRLKVVLDLVRKIREEGRKPIILDISETGSGKSHEFGETTYELFGVNRLFWVSESHRNPTVETVERNFADMIVRNSGLYQDESKPRTPLGNIYTRWPQEEKGERPNTPGNCSETKTFHYLASKGYLADTSQTASSNTICRIKCRSYASCAGIVDKDGDQVMSPIPGRTYIQECRDFFATNKNIRISINSLPHFKESQAATEEDSEEKAPEKVGLIIDEFFSQYKPTSLTQVDKSEFDTAWGYLESAVHGIAKEIATVTQKLELLIEMRNTASVKQAKEIAELTQIQQQLTDLFISAVPALELVKPILFNIRRVLHGQEVSLDPQATRYGWNEIQLLEIVGELPEGFQDAIAVIRQLKPNLSQLFEGIDADSVNKDSIQGNAKEKKGHGQTLKHIREHFADEANSKMNQRIEDLPSNCIIPLLEVIGGCCFGSFRIKNGTLEIVTRNDHHQKQLNAADLLIVLDATLSVRSLANALNIQESEIVVICQEPSTYENLTIKHVKGLGKLTRTRGESLKERVEVLLTHLGEVHPSLGVIDHLSTKREGEGHWFADSRGTNVFQEKEALATLGAPYQDIGALAMTYAATTGDKNAVRGNPGFDAFVKEIMHSEMIQAGGRLRAHRRNEQELAWYVVTEESVDYLKQAFPRAKFEEVSAFSIVAGAGSKSENLAHMIFQSMQKLAMRNGEHKLTQEDIAQDVGCKQSTVSKKLNQHPAIALIGGAKGLLKIFQSLLAPNRKRNNLKTLLQEDFTEEEKFVIETYFPALVEQEDTTPEILMAECVEIAQIVGWKAIRVFIGRLSLSKRVDMLTSLVGHLSADWQGCYLALNE